MKKLLSLTLSLVMILSMSCFAITPEEGAKELGKYGIMGGFPDGSLRLEQNVTRAQITKMLTTALEFDNQNMGNHSRFSDLPATHWAKNYIIFAQMEEIIGGFPDGTFRPEDNVTTHQAIKMVVCLLEYDKVDQITWVGNTPTGTKIHSFPNDYLDIAVKYGLIDRSECTPIATNATRGFVAKLIAKALDLPLGKATGLYDGAPKYELMDGKDGRAFITLRTKLEDGI